ncbi:hypothetical protein PHMEG_00026181 [Phytophthora megakarya]|uniref:MULE transposase domain-containing protein n=1 Tax=Phytophthora megakarya TaxID=4795 RepID=A0A225VB07_9STRA|nr:hypothetical protein PHMEG_00026181 [Phytophthora megakarya]
MRGKDEGLIRLLMHPGASLFIDATYSIMPRPFQQTLVIMAHDPDYDVYTPVLTILLEAKDERSYWHALHWVCVLGNMKMTPASITCEFEAALIPPTFWNVNSYIEKEIAMQNRTNNPVESYNR